MFVFWQSETIIQVKQRSFIVCYMTKHSRIFGVFCSLVQEFFHPFEHREGPRDKAEPMPHSLTDVIIQHIDTLPKYGKKL